MKAVQKGDELFRHTFIPRAPRRSKPASRRAGVIDVMAFLGRAFRVDPKTKTLSRFFCLQAKAAQLAWGIKDHMVGILKDLIHFIVSVGAGKDMDLSLGHLSRPRRAS